MNIQSHPIHNSIFTEKKDGSENLNENSGPQMGGAFPINKLSKNSSKQFENYGVPMGLVLNNNNILEGGNQNNLKIEKKESSLINDQLFDKLYNKIHINIPFQTNTTRKNHK